MTKNNYLSDHEQEVIYNVILVSSILSLIGSLFVCFVYLAFKSLRVFAFRLVFYLASVDVFISISFMIPYDKGNSVRCRIQGAAITYFTLSEVLWTSVIAHTLYSSAIKNASFENYHLKYCLFSFGIPLIATIIPWIGDFYGPSNGWCWIVHDKGNEGYHTYLICLKLALFYIPLWLVIIYNFAVYMKIIRKLQENEGSFHEHTNIRRVLIMKLRLYPLVLMVCQGPVSVFRLFSFSDEGYAPFELVLLSGIGICINGFLNAVIYGLTRQVRKEIAKIICKYKTEGRPERETMTQSLKIVEE
ncbi:GCR1_1 [Blepharisma stoltei]|uniref:G-protein coupled receptors family 2 profile 2 domain-containing protein n=1 Tax=Blepharisma stoltei TaxID=1481888 RepID=A0AAU9J265_9CILI|nr:unnamed protein product [Blepharisma stoltei]